MDFLPRHIIRLLCSCVVTLVLVSRTSCDPSPGISLGGLSLSFGSGGNKGWESQPSHGWAPAPAKSWAPPPKAAPSFSISLPKPNIAQLLAIPLKVLQYKLNAFGNQQISFKFTLPRISISKNAAPAPKGWSPPPQGWAPAPPQGWAPAPQGWASAPQPQPWKPEPQGWKSQPESHGWKAPEPQAWKSAPPKGWQPPAGWKPPQGWQPENSIKSAGWNKK